MADDKPPEGGKGKNFLTRKIGPLPTWGWAAIGVGGYLIYRFYSQSKASSTAATTLGATSATGTTAAAGGIDYGPQIATLQAEVSQLQGSQSTGSSSEGSSSGGGTKKKKHPPVPIDRGPGPPKQRWYRHVSNGTQTFNTLVHERHTTIGDILAISRQAPETPANIKKLEEWAAHPGSRRKGVVYYTKNP